MDKGVYALVLENPQSEVRVGALGVREFAAGWHIYVGSALGSGGLARADRHVRLARHRDRSPRWHIDYLLLDPRFMLTAVVTAVTGKDRECALAREIGGPCVSGFGCSDCTCLSHLFYRSGDPMLELVAAFARLGLDARIATIKNVGSVH